MKKGKKNRVAKLLLNETIELSIVDRTVKICKIFDNRRESLIICSFSCFYV